MPDAPLKPDPSRADALGVRGTRAMVASVGASMALVVAGVVALAVVSALIGFRGLPGVAASLGMGQQQLVAAASSAVPAEGDPTTMADVAVPDDDATDITLSDADRAGGAPRRATRDRAAAGGRSGRDGAGQAAVPIVPAALPAPAVPTSTPIRLPAPVPTSTPTKEPTRTPTESVAQPEQQDTPSQPTQPTTTPTPSVPIVTSTSTAPTPAPAPVANLPLPVTVSGTPVSIVVTTQPVRDLGEGLDSTVTAVGETAAQAVSGVVPSLGPTVAATTGTVGDVVSGTTDLVSGLVDGLVGGVAPPPAP